MRHELDVRADPADVAAAAATFVAETARRCVAASGRFVVAVSGGRTPWAMFADLVTRDVPWPQTFVYQVDERVAPAGDPARNLTQLERLLGPTDAVVKPMPVDDDDLDAAARRYAEELPGRFDLVHLGLGPDGHTASLVPGDDVLQVSDRLVALTSVYQGHRRMTLTYPALARASELLWLVTGSDKTGALDRLLAGDVSIPAGRVTAGRSLVLADAAARRAAQDPSRPT